MRDSLRSKLMQSILIFKI
ncbi:hypothetical protein [Virgibacillus pantothenticus]